MEPQPKHLQIMEALHQQVKALDSEPMSPVERHLAIAILVTLNVLIDMHPAKD